MTISDGHRRVRWDYVRVIGLDLNAVQHFEYGNRCRAGQDLWQEAFVRGIEMLDDDIRHPRIPRKAAQEARERFETAGRGADSDDRWPRRAGER
jgi:hypothetical protein